MTELEQELERETLEFLEWLNGRYKCTCCHETPGHAPSCRFYTLLQAWRTNGQTPKKVQAH